MVQNSRMVSECIWSLELLTWESNPPLFDRRHLKNCLMPDFLIDEMKRSEGPLQCHDLDQEASGESGVQGTAERAGGLRWVRSLALAASRAV